MDLGAVTLTGEIVDTKCHLGVMNPGEGKVHRDCAVRCISGGAPPVSGADQEGDTRLLLLTGADGRRCAARCWTLSPSPSRLQDGSSGKGPPSSSKRSPATSAGNNRALSRM